jgi:hypothetical protein
MSKANKDKWTDICGKHGERENIPDEQRPAVGKFTA